MLRIILIIVAMCGISTFFQLPVNGQTPPDQPSTGPGGSEYKHAEIRAIDLANNSNGCWVFLPEAPVPDKAPVVVFTHGYGGINPMIYGRWIRHLVRKGNIVIYPRYQIDLILPRPPEFAGNTARGIKKGLAYIDKNTGIRPDLDKFALIGHSYGGVVNANLAVNWKSFDIPKPAAVMLCQPGTGPLKGGKLDSYADFPGDIPLLIITGENDHTVGEAFAYFIFNSAINTENRNLVRHKSDFHGFPAVSASHHECYSVDTTLDNGLRNYTAKSSLERSKLDVLDYFCYWKLGDALLDCAFYQSNCQTALGNTPEQSGMGCWSDGTPVTPLEVLLPATERLNSTIPAENKKE